MFNLQRGGKKTEETGNQQSYVDTPESPLGVKKIHDKV